jgi:hypothetical protein
VSRIVYTGALALVTLALILVAGRVVVDDLAVGLGGWLTLAWLALLGLAAVLPWGAVVGAPTRTSTSSTGLTFLVLGALVGISGIFYPLSAMPGWLQGAAQVFPMYWLGHGMRAALLPDAAAVAELGGDWRLWQAAAVLGAWTVLGLLVAPADGPMPFIVDRARGGNVGNGRIGSVGEPQPVDPQLRGRRPRIQVRTSRPDVRLPRNPTETGVRGGAGTSCS